MAAASPGANRWLFGPVPDLLFGCGLLYVVIWVASALAGPSLRAVQPHVLFPLLVLVLSMPHYGATLLRVYEQRESRRSYVVFSLWATLAVAAAFVAGTYSAVVGTWMLTIYLTWSPWHYTGQNYGLAVMFLRRRGVPVTPGAKRWVYASFGLSYALAFLIMHAARGYWVDRPLLPDDTTFRFQPLGVPDPVLNLAFPALGLAYLGSLAVAAWILLRGASARDLLPTAALALTQMLWFVAPLVPRLWPTTAGIEPLGTAYRTHYLYWIILGHAVQYLWVTTYYARGSDGWRGYGSYFAKILVAGVALWHLPSLLFSEGRIGNLTWNTGLALLLTSAINIHHFILDGAIWKLRNSRIAGVLIRGGHDTDASATRGPGWPRRLVWATAVAGFLVGAAVFWDSSVRYPRAVRERDFVGAHQALDRLTWFGRSDETLRRQTRGIERRRGAAPDVPDPPPSGY